MEIWSDQLQSIQYGPAIQMIVYDGQAGRYSLVSAQGTRELSRETANQLIYQNGNLFKNATALGQTMIYVFALEEDVEAITKAALHNLILSLRYGEEGYVWVNEVLNYEGGDDYAIRVIHPTMPEGEYLSTSTEDIKGNFPYAKELEGVRTDGEIFHTYYFKKASGDGFAEKASYAALYKPYDWIVATGDPLGALTQYSETIAVHTRDSYQRSLWEMAVLLVAVSAVGVTVMVLANQRYRKGMEAYVRKETEFDALTGALSRKTGEAVLTEAFEHDSRGEKHSLLMMGDIDDFKQVNDTYGHAAGDEVLRGVAQTLTNSVRRTDQVFRWGGEEFVILCRNVAPQYHQQVGEQLLQSIRNLSFELNGESVSITISIGASYFQEGDETYNAALERADAGLYVSKRTGKDRYTHAEDLKAALAHHQGHTTTHP